MKKIIVFCVAFLATMSLWASETSVNAIWYDFDSYTKTASVTYKGSYSSEDFNEYTGEVVIPSTVTYGGEEYSVTSIGENAFAYCRSLTSITIPESVTSIGSWAFDDCNSLTSIDVASNNNNYTSIDGVLFSKDKTILIRCPEGKATSYTIPDGVTEIGEGAFWACRDFTSITIPESVTEIGDVAFVNCRSLRSVTIPSGVTKIGDGAFYECTGFTSITCKNTIPPIIMEPEFEGENCTFDGVYKFIPLYVPAESVEVYNNTKYWREFTNIQAIPSSSVANANAETQDSVRKEYRDGQVLIIKGDKTYTMFGTEY